MPDPMPPTRTGPRFLATEARRAHAVSSIFLCIGGGFQYLVGVVMLALMGSYATFALYVLCGTVFVLLGVWVWRIASAGYTELTPAGLVTRQTRARTIEWHTITDIQPERRGRYWRVRVRCRTGRSLILVAPLTRASQPDPRFGAELEMMRAAWHAATGLGTSRSWHPAG